MTGGEVYLRSVDNSYCYRLPSIPGFSETPINGSLHASLDGRIYVLGGGRWGSEDEDGSYGFSSEVYMLDFSGHKQWKRCSSMNQARGAFGGAVLHGKMYVFGGCQSLSVKSGATRIQEPLCGAEVYDPQENTWTSIKSIPNLRSHHHVVQSGPVFVMLGGFLHHIQKSGSRAGEYKRILDPESVEIYYPGRDDWTVLSCDDVFSPRRTILGGKTTTMGDPSLLIGKCGAHLTHIGPTPYLYA